MDSLGDVTLGYWKRYGKERVYANGVSGSRLGFIDLATGEVTLEPGSDPRVEDVLRSWRPEGTLAPASSTADDMDEIVPAEGAGARADVSQEPATPAWTDLAQNRPGAGVRAEAEAAWSASKDRSKFWAYTGRILNVHTDERAWRVGAEGEEAIGARLDKLRDHGWRVLHSIPVGERGSDIDHVLVGPGGVFTVNSKNHPGGKIWVAKYQMRVNGQVVPYLRNARHEATRASRLLTQASGVDVSVRSCVIVLTGTIVPEVTIKQMPDDVMVLDRMDVPKWFGKRPAALSEESIERIFDAARRSTTWTNQV
ncbi:nuclease-related domain-containing protein [Demequina lignilytica]|uniref:Nuclease-related domain-containing protein n=1 Tax=Demequina lignilytica TaxID=3051663 RepID=A0AB35MHM7_9MICO|nr:nuclease-related domain-containing protein [Demequina sp. SYSU T0a273]MDN4483198.1 nuclease-related domain-containing protein [Demequina sp. SYSU T0a273]